MKLVVAAADAGKRLDVWLTAQLPGRSRRAVKTVIEGGHVRVGGKKARAGVVVRAGDTVELAVVPPTAEDLRPTPEAAPLEIVYQDDALVAIAKPAGMASHPLRAGELGTAASALVARFPELARVGADPREAGLAHRLDAETSGVLLAARNQDVWHTLREAFHEHRVVKRYLALCSGKADVGQTGRVDAPIAHDGADRRRVLVCADDEQAVKRQAKSAHTTWRVVRRVGDLYWVSAEAETGRMHQVRAHLAFAGLPLAGDPLYGAGVLSPLGRHVLHAAELELDHPVTRARLRIVAPPPPDVAALTR
jgi:23S rRNA pseudouridine1911/1915/1917 synthase